MPKNTKTENSSAKKSGTKTVKSEPKAKSAPKVKAAPKAEPVAETKAEPKAETKVEPKVEPKAADTKVAKKSVTKKTVKKATAKKGTKKASTKKDAKKAGGKKATKKATKKPASKKPKATDADGEQHGRFFKVVLGDDNPHGRFSGSKPKQAAAKALTSILRSREESGASIQGQIKFSIVECTRGSRHKTYNYVGERVELDAPMEITIGKGDDAKVITYRYNNKVMKDKSE